MEEIQEKKSLGKKIVDIVLWVFLAFALALTIFTFIAHAGNHEYPCIGDNALFTVRSNSMKGKDGFNKGDLIICNPLASTQKYSLKEGDVITFYVDLTPDDGKDNKVLNTHRIMEIVPGVGYQTKGDNNPVQDGYVVNFEDVEAIWTGKKVPLIGSAISFFQSSTGFLVCVVLPLGAFFIYEVVSLILTIKGMKDGDKKVALSADEEEAIKQRAIAEYLAKQQAEQAAKEESKEDENKPTED